MSYCSQCGAPTATGATFCDNCGARLVGSSRFPVQVPTPWPGGTRALNQAPWTGGIIGAGVAFALLLVVTIAIIDLQFRSYIGQLPPEARPFGAMFQSLRRPLLGMYLYSGHLMTLRGSVSMKERSLGSSGSVQGRVRVPLAGLLVLPALALTIGGFTAARMANAQTPSEGARAGSRVAVPYALLLLLSLPTLSIRLDGLPVPSALRGTLGLERIPIGIEMGPGVLGALFYGLLWGALFGAIGGMWAAGGGLRTALKSVLNLRLRNWAAGTYGACVALTVGLLLAAVLGLLIGVAGARRVGLTRPADLGGLPFRPATIDLLLTVVQVPPSIAVLSYPLLHGVPGRFEISLSGPMSASAQGGISILGRNAWFTARTPDGPEAQSKRLPPWTVLALLVPVTAIVVGGRAAGGMAQGQPPLTVGLQVGIVYTIGLVLLGHFGRIGAWHSGTIVIPFAGSQSAHIAAVAGPTLLGTVIAGLLWGAVLGTVGAWLAGGVQRFCDTCGGHVRPGVTFCDQCGGRIG